MANKTQLKRSKLSLYDEQSQIYNIILDRCIEDDKQQLFFIEGPSGSGKTFLLSHLINAFEKNGLRVVVVAATGVGATLLKNGRTFHWTFWLRGSGENIYSGHNDFSQRQLVSTLKESDIIIWDQATNASKYAFSAVDRKLRDWMCNEEIFGGKNMILAGDFRQILPIQRNASESERLQLSFKFSEYLQHFERLQLTRKMRCDFPLLRSIEAGDKNETINGISDCIKIPKSFMVSSIDQLVYAVFGKKLLIEDPPVDKVILVYDNSKANLLNNGIVKLLEGPEKHYSIVNEEQPKLPEKLILKVGALVMLTNNLNISLTGGYCKGLRMIVERMEDDEVTCRIITPGSQYGQVIAVNRLRFDNQFYGDEEWQQPCENNFPLKLAYVLTIDMAQGLTMNHVGILLLENDILSHGHLYVAFGICRKSENIKIAVGFMPEKAEVAVFRQTENAKVAKGRQPENARVARMQEEEGEEVEEGKEDDDDGCYVQNVICREILK